MFDSSDVRPGIPLVVLTAVAFALLLGQWVSSQGQSAGHRQAVVNGYEAVDGEVLVRFNRGLSTAERQQLERQLDAAESEPLAPGVRRLRSRSFDTAALLAHLRTREDVAVAEPNYIVYAADTLPDDPGFANQWGLFNTGQTVNGDWGTGGSDVHALAAWDVSTGSTSHVVAVVDTGIDYNHPDLAANIWSAPVAFDVTIGGTLVHCNAGTHGFNAITKTCNPMDDNNHGTHVSGTIGAVGNNGVGVAGVNWTASIMGSKFLNSAGSGTISDAINAIEFTIQARQALGSAANVRVLSNSWAGGGFSQLLLNEINRANANGMLFVAAAGNEASNNDVSPSYPSGYNAPNVVAVAATDNDDILATFSNVGAASVDLAAPGVNILSTTRNNTYAFYSGTSMATPHVSGAAALLLSVCGLDTAGVRNTMLANVDVVAALTGLVATGGRLNVDKAIRACASVPPPPQPSPPSAPTQVSATPGNGQVVLSWAAPTGAISFTVRRGTSAGSEPTTVASGVSTTTYTDRSLTNGTTYYYVVVAVNGAGSSPDSAQVSATPVGPPAAPTGLTAVQGPSKGQISLSWTASPGASSYTVKRKASNGGGAYATIATGVTTKSFVDGKLKSGRLYFYVVSAVNAVGSSPDSGPVSAIAK